jgi:hypothetical protein
MSGITPAGTGEGSSPYIGTAISRARLDQALPARSPLYQPPQPPLGHDEAEGESFVGRLQPSLGFSGGAYALNTAFDTGSPTEAADTALPGLRDGAYRFSARLRSQGDQGVIDSVLRDGGGYLEVRQPPYV